MAFPPIDVLGVVSPALLTASRGIHGLAIYAGGGARGVRLLLSADPLAEQVVDGVQGAVVPPLIEVPPHSRLGREVLGEVTPLAAGTQDVEDGIDYVAQVGLAWSAAGVDGQLRLDQKPLRVGYVAGVGLCSHESFYASSPPLMGQSLSGGRFSSLDLRLRYAFCEQGRHVSDFLSEAPVLAATALH